MPEVEPPLKLNIGSGLGEIPGYLSIDRKLGVEAWPLNYADDSVDEIRASHILEHASHRDTESILREWVRALKPGGVLKLAVPDIDRAYALRAAGDPNIEKYIMGAHLDDDDIHGALFDEPTTREQMRTVGLRQIRPWKSEVRDCASLSVSLNLMGVKRGRVNISGVIPVMTIPRLGFTDHYRVAQRAFVRLGMSDPAVTGGAFWHQGLTRAIEMALGQPGARYVLSLDYDSLFGPEQVEDLIWLAETSQSDAVCSLQVRRQTNQTLFCMKDENGGWKMTATLADFEPELVPLISGHLGLTLIRADAFAKVPKPWFHAEPDGNGEWGEKSVDADTSFWKKFDSAGLKLMGAPHVSIGHAQVMASWVGRNGVPVHQYVEDFLKNGIPPNAWR